MKIGYGRIEVHYTGELDDGFVCMFTIMINEETFVPKGKLHAYNDEGFLELEVYDLDVDIQAGDVVKVKYEPKHPDDIVEDILGQEIEVTGEWITVQIVE